MIRNIIFHIGVHKTATTTIQNTLHNEREKLAAYGVLYPVFFAGQTLFTNHSIPFFSLFGDDPARYHVNITHGYTSDGAIHTLHQEYLCQLRQQAASFDGDTMIISGEDLSYLNIQQLANLRKLLTEVTHPEANIRIVVVCRHPVSRFRSFLQSSVCNFGMRMKVAIEYHLTVRKLSYKNLIGTFATVFGREMITVLKYEDIMTHPSGPAGALLELIDPFLSEKIRPEVVRENSGTSFETVILCDAINGSFPDTPGFALNPERMITVGSMLSKMPGPPFALPEKLSRKVWTVLSEDIHWLTQEFSLTPYREIKADLNSFNELWSQRALQYLAENIHQLPGLYRKAIGTSMLKFIMVNRKIRIKQQIRMLGFLISNRVSLFASKK
jgi:hypothetical protein